jgi:chemotaxis protein methyltransferase CheR
MFRDKNPGFSFQILGTDISQQMVELCKNGVYRGRSVESFKKTMPGAFDRYMEQNGEECQVISEIRGRLKFRTHNLFQRLSGSEKFDLILLRNVLIYFTPTDQEIVVGKLVPALANDGTLIIGESESLANIKSDFCHLEPLIYQKKNVA